MSTHDLELAAVQEALAGVWSIERELGRGGMGVVYLARDVALDRAVAIKVLHAQQADQRERFVSEARMGARLTHPNIVPIYAVDDAGPFVYFVMGLVDGESLGQRIRREGPLSPATTAGVLRDVSWALAYAHAAGIVHRDVTIDNILIERNTGRALLADFGIAAEVERAGDGPLIGTPAYLAPELVGGAAPSRQSDIYALGIAAWTMLVGRVPFVADDTATVLLQQISEPPPSLSAAAPATPSRMVRAIEHALQKDPAERPETVELWLQELAADGGEVALATPLRRWLNRWEVIRPFYALGMTVTAMMGLKAGIDFGMYRLGSRIAIQTLMRALGAFLTVMAVVAAVHIAVEIAALRRLTRAGYSREDLELALALRRGERRTIGNRRPTLLGRVVNDLTWLGGITYGLMAFAFIPRVPHAPYQTSIALQLLLGSIARWAYMVFWSGLGLGFIVPGFHFKPDGWFNRLTERFWRSRPADGLIAVASYGLGGRVAADQTLHRPTELALDLAIDEMWAALPEATRLELDELPVAARGLRRRVSEAKELVHQLDQPVLIRSTEADALRQRLVARQEAGVNALERLRLQLARLATETAPMGEFTQQLADARQVEAELLAELGAHASVKRLLKQRRATPDISPTPSPA